MARGSWVTLMLGFGSLNILLLGAEIWVAHLVGPVTSDAAEALSAKPGQIYLSNVLTSGVPLLVWAMVLAAGVFGAVEAVRWLRADKLPDEMAASTKSRQRSSGPACPRSAERLVLVRAASVPAKPGIRPRTRAPAESGRGRSPGCSSSGARRTTPSGCCGSSSSGNWSWPRACGNWSPAAGDRPQRRHRPGRLGVARAGGVPVRGVEQPRQAAHDRDLVDVGTFWPRSYHPLCPPCYAERAVPDLQRRMWWLHDNDGRVMLVAHSQGTVLAVAALAQTACRPEDDHPALITFGSPVCKLYGWAFPAYFDRALLAPWPRARPRGSTTGGTSTTRRTLSADRWRPSCPRWAATGGHEFPDPAHATTCTASRRPRPRATPATGRTAGSGM